MENRVKRVTVGAMLLALPVYVNAQGLNTEFFGAVLAFIYRAVDVLVPLVIALAVLLFLWGLLGMIRAVDTDEGRTRARQRMLWGILILFVMVSVWGLVNVLDRFFNLHDAPPPAPQVRYSTE